MRSILIISDSYYPDPGIQSRRIGERAEYLISKGFEVTIVCPTSINSKKKDYIHNKVVVKRIKPFFKNICTNFEYWNLRKNNSFFKFIPYITPLFGYIRWIIPVVAILNKGCYKNTILYTYNNPITLHIIGLLTKYKFKKWIVEFRDPIVNYEFSHRSNLFKYIDNIYEKMIIKNADKVCFRKGIQMSKKELLERNPLFAEKIQVLPDYGVNLNDFKYSLQKRVMENCIGLFAGSFYGKSSPDNLIESVINYNNVSDAKIELHFYGDIDIETNNRYVKKLGKIQYQELIKQYQSCDFTIIYDQARFSDSKKYFVPSKLSELIAAQKPILYIGNLDTITAKTIKENSIGIISEDNTQCIYSAIIQIYEMIIKDNFNHSFLKQVSEEIDLFTSEEKFFELTI